MTITTRQIRLVRVARRAPNLTGEEYRSALVQIGGVERCTELDQAGFEALVGYFEYRGFAPLAARGPSFGDRPGMASYARIELIRTLWTGYTRGAADAARLTRWVERCFKVSSLRFLTPEVARKAITALKMMKSRAA